LRSLSLHLRVTSSSGARPFEAVCNLEGPLRPLGDCRFAEQRKSAPRPVRSFVRSATNGCFRVLGPRSRTTAVRAQSGHGMKLLCAKTSGKRRSPCGLCQIITDLSFRHPRPPSKTSEATSFEDPFRDASQWFARGSGTVWILGSVAEDNDGEGCARRPRRARVTIKNAESMTPESVPRASPPAARLSRQRMATPQTGSQYGPRNGDNPAPGLQQIRVFFTKSLPFCPHLPSPCHAWSAPAAGWIANVSSWAGGNAPGLVR